MAILLVHDESADSTPAVSSFVVTPSVAPTAAVVQVFEYTASVSQPTITSISQTNVTWTRRSPGAGVNTRSETWVGEATGAPGVSLTVNLSGTTSAGTRGNYSQWSGLDTVPFHSAAIAGSGTSTTPTTNLVAPPAGREVLLIATSRHGAPYASGPTNSFTALSSTSANFSPAYRIVSIASGNYLTAWTVSSSGIWDADLIVLLGAPLTATVTGNVPIDGAASGTIAVSASIAGDVVVAGSASATVVTGGTVTGTVTGAVVLGGGATVTVVTVADAATRVGSAKYVASGAAQIHTLSGYVINLVADTNRKQLVSVAWASQHETLGTLTYNGVPLSRVAGSLADATSGVPHNKVEFFYLDDIDHPLAAGDLVATFSGVVTECTIIIQELAEAAQGQPEAVAIAANGTNASAVSAAIATLTNSSTVFSVCSFSTAAALSLGAGQTIVQKDETGPTVGMSYEVVSLAGGDVQSFSIPGGTTRQALSAVAIASAELVSVAPTVFDIRTTAKALDDVAGATHTFAFTVVDGVKRKLMIQPAWYDAVVRQVVGITFAGVALTRIDEAAALADTTGIESFFLDDAGYPSPGTYNFIVTYDGSVSLKRAAVIDMVGAAQGYPPAGTAGNFGTLDASTSIQKTITTFAADSLILAGATINENGPVVTPDAGQTVHQSYLSVANSVAWSYEVKAVAGGETEGFTFDGTSAPRLAITVVAVRPSLQPTMYLWDGSSWVPPGVLKVWTGPAWVEKPMYVEV